MIAVFGVAYGNIGEAICKEIPGTNSINCMLPDVSDEVIEGHRDFIFCNGINQMAWIGKQNDADIDQHMFDNLTSIMKTINRIAQRKPRSEPTRIVIICSLAAKRVMNASSAYCSSKAALEMYIKCAAFELAKMNIHVFGVNPGIVEDTPMSYDIINQIQYIHNLNHDDAKAYWSKVNNLGEYAKREDVAKIVSWLFKPEARFLSGACIDMHGSNR